MVAAYNWRVVGRCPHGAGEEIALPAEQPVAAEAALLTADALVDILARFADAGNRPHLDALMSLMTDAAGQTIVVDGGQILPESKLAIR